LDRRRLSQFDWFANFFQGDQHQGHHIDHRVGALSNRTEADFQAWRDARDWNARKYAMWDVGERLPSQKPQVP
jgi:hypothetical protein